MFESWPCSSSQDKPAEVGCWYLSREEIEENSPSRRDGIDLKKEKYLRKSYCIFLQELGIRLYLPQLTIATATVFCHRFFLRQSHAKNDRRTIATVCMFLAGKVEVTPRPLEVLVPVSYAIIHKKDPAAAEKIKLKDVFDQQVKLILLGEKAVLATLAFDLDVHHPYNTLLGAVKKFKASRNEIAQFAWNFINDGLKTSLCLQYKPQQIAAAAIFLAANYLKVKILHDGEKVWWQEFDVTPQQLEEIGNQILELYEQNPMPLSSDSEVEESTMVESSHRTAAGQEESDAESGCSKAPSTVKAAASMPTSFQSVYDHSYSDDQSVPQSTQSPRSPYGGAEMEVGQWKDEGAQEDEIETVFDRELEEVMHNFNLLNEPEPEYPDHGKALSDSGSRG